MSTMTVRPHARRILFDLVEIRQELISVTADISPEELDWSPAPGMKSYRDLLIEIGAIEAENLGLIKTGTADYNAAVDKLGGRGRDVQSVLADLEKIRRETVDFLEDVAESQLQEPLELPKDWYDFFGGSAIEPEELLRWIVRHEYYHLGQIVTMRWMQGHDPYRGNE